MANEDVKELLARWDNNEILEGVEMGGLGPSYYEQGIQMGIMEILREYLRIPEAERPDLKALDTKALGDLLDKWLFAAMKTEPKLDGITGAMAGAMQQVASKYIAHGVEKTLKTMRDRDPSRIIFIKKEFP